MTNIPKKIIPVHECEEQEAIKRQGISANKQTQEIQKRYYQGILETLIRDPLFWEVIVEKVTGRPFHHPGVATSPTEDELFHARTSEMCSKCGGWKAPKNRAVGYAGKFCECDNIKQCHE